MKSPSVVTRRLLSAGAVSVVCLLALPLTAYAKGPPSFAHGRDKPSKNQKSHQHGSDAYAKQAYSSRPRSGFILSFGTGYAGSGYYYGPPNSPYYYQRSDVRYYAARNLAPREYYSHPANRSDSMSSAVQRELAQRGFYQGYIDGQIGPQSRRAIVRYQHSRGMPQTGEITSSLLFSLGLQ